MQSDFARCVYPLLVVLSLIGCEGSAPRQQRALSVFVAASMVDVADSLVAGYVASNPDTRVNFNVGASSSLARQISLGAQADIFLSADTLWSSYLLKRRPTSVGSALPATNSLVVVARDRLESVSDLVSLQRIAVADPSHVPAGRYARTSLECLGFWKTIEPRLIPAADVRAALASAATGAVDAAIVYRTDAAILARTRGSTIDIPGRCQPAITLALVNLANGDAAVDSLAAHFLSRSNLGIWQSFGFEEVSQ